VHEVHVATTDPRELAKLVGERRLDQLLGSTADDLRRVLGDRSVVNINASAAGGGVAEMLGVLLAYARGAGVDARWLVIEGDEAFFAITKRLHNHLYGTPGDGGPLGNAEHDHYREIIQRNEAELAAVVKPGDIVILHDPQPLGMAAALQARGAIVVWRCHVGIDGSNEHTERGWSFLRPYLLHPELAAYVFTRSQFAPRWLPPEGVRTIPPSIDPFSLKNIDIAADHAGAILTAAGLIGGTVEPVTFLRSDGSPGRIDHGSDVFRTGPPPGPDVPLVVQVSRWDRLKDMAGVLRAFAEFAVADHDAHLVLAGPVVSAVADDPEGAGVLTECVEAWRSLPHAARIRVQLACLPMADGEENAIMVNALQRHAHVVVQKSLAEGFGLTVAEAMFKERPVVASPVGGIVDQINDGKTGILLGDPTDQAAFGQALDRLFTDARLARRLGSAGRQHVIDQFLPDRHLARWSGLLRELLA
jgi:trehalose synthase